MKKTLVSIFLAMTSTCFAGGDVIGNGGGLAEKNILIAARSAGFYSKLCVSSEVCRLNKKEKLTLQKILTALPQEFQSSNPIRFLSEKKNPGFFMIDGEVKIAKTGSRIGDPIYVNTDLLYSRNKFGVWEALSIPNALAVMIHEYGHHISEDSHEVLDLLGVKVSLALQNRIQSTPLLPWNQSVSVTVIQPSELRAFPQVLLTVGDQVQDLSQSFRAALRCPELRLPLPIPLPLFPGLKHGSRPPEGAIFHNVHWEKATRQGLQGDYTAIGNLTLVCEGRETEMGVNSFQLRVGFSVRQSGSDLMLVSKSVGMAQDYQPWFPLFPIR